MILFRSFVPGSGTKKTRQTSFVAQDDADDDDEIDDDDNKNINDVYDDDNDNSDDGKSNAKSDYNDADDNDADDNDADDNNNDDNDANNAQLGSPQQRQMWGSLKGETILPVGGLCYKLYLVTADVWFTTQLMVVNLCKVAGQNICLELLRICHYLYDHHKAKLSVIHNSAGKMLSAASSIRTDFWNFFARSNV